MTATHTFKEHVAGVFTRASSSYDHVGPRFFSSFGRKLVEFTGITVGSEVLDVACGRGAVLFPACKAVGATGRVSGIDMSDGMIEEIEAEVSGRGLPNARILKMDAENVDLPESSFDFVLCGLALFFFPNLDRALDGFLRVLKTGGQFAVSTFERVEDERDKRLREIAESFKDYLKPAPGVEINRLDSQEVMRQVLSEVGLVEIEVAPDKETFYYRDEEEWWEAAWSNGYRAFLERMDDDTLARYKRRTLEVMREEKTDRGISITLHLLYAKGRKP